MRKEQQIRQSVEIVKASLMAGGLGDVAQNLLRGGEISLPETLLSQAIQAQTNGEHGTSDALTYAATGALMHGSEHASRFPEIAQAMCRAVRIAAP